MLYPKIASLFISDTLQENVSHKIHFIEVCDRLVVSLDYTSRNWKVAFFTRGNRLNQTRMSKILNQKGGKK